MYLGRLRAFQKIGKDVTLNSFEKHYAFCQSMTYGLSG